MREFPKWLMAELNKISRNAANSLEDAQLPETLKHGVYAGEIGDETNEVHETRVMDFLEEQQVSKYRRFVENSMKTLLQSLRYKAL